MKKLPLIIILSLLGVGCTETSTEVTKKMVVLGEDSLVQVSDTTETESFSPVKTILLTDGIVTGILIFLGIMEGQ